MVEPVSPLDQVTVPAHSNASNLTLSPGQISILPHTIIGGCGGVFTLIVIEAVSLTQSNFLQ